MSITEEVHTWLEGEGFPLEMRVAAAFRKAGFEVRQSDVYMDHESGKTGFAQKVLLFSNFLCKMTLCTKIRPDDKLEHATDRPTRAHDIIPQLTMPWRLHRHEQRSA